MNFCSNCGNPVTQRIPAGEDRLRYVCDQCDTIHYQNPHIITGCLVTHGDQVLLCKRAIEPRHGLWTLPAGFMENGETTEQGAARETWEEALAKVDIKDLYAIFNLPQINQVYIMFRGELVGEEFGAGPESLETQLFDEADIPWDELAFPMMKTTLEYYFEDRKTGNFPIRRKDLIREPKHHVVTD